MAIHRTTRTAGMAGALGLALAFSAPAAVAADVQFGGLVTIDAEDPLELGGAKNPYGDLSEAGVVALYGDGLRTWTAPWNDLMSWSDTTIASGSYFSIGNLLFDNEGWCYTAAINGADLNAYLFRKGPNPSDPWETLPITTGGDFYRVQMGLNGGGSTLTFSTYNATTLRHQLWRSTDRGTSLSLSASYDNGTDAIFGAQASTLATNPSNNDGCLFRETFGGDLEARCWAGGMSHQFDLETGIPAPAEFSPTYLREAKAAHVGGDYFAWVGLKYNGVVGFYSVDVDAGPLWDTDLGSATLTQNEPDHVPTGFGLSPTGSPTGGVKVAFTDYAGVARDLFTENPQAHAYDGFPFTKAGPMTIITVPEDESVGIYRNRLGIALQFSLDYTRFVSTATAAQNIPALGPWALAALAGLVFLMAGWALRQRRAP